MIQDELELKSRSFVLEITVVQGLVSFNITSIQFGVLQLQRKLLKTFPKNLDGSFVQTLISKLFKLFGIIFIHAQVEFFYHCRNYEALLSLQELHAQEDVCLFQLKSNPLTH